MTGPSTTSKEPDKVETILTLNVPPGQHADTRLDQYLTRFLPNATRTKVQRGIKEGRVTVNGRILKKPAYIVQPGDELICRMMRPPPIEARPEAIPLDIRYEDDHLIVLNKPAGMVVHPAYGNRTGTLVNALLHHVGAGPLHLDDDPKDLGLSTVQAVPRYEGDPTIRPGLVHRLDKDTTGLMVVAKTNAAHVHLSRQFYHRTIHRRYQAVVWGHPDPAEGRIETQLGRNPRDRKRMAVVPKGKGKHAVTHYRTLERLHHAARVEFRLETGRTHQIRVHAQHLGHPIFGDPTYGGQVIRYGLVSGRRKAMYANLFKVLPRQALHAYTLGFRHPESGEVLDFEAELPADMQMVLDRLRGEIA